MITSVTTLVKLVFVVFVATILKSCQSGAEMSGGSAKKGQNPANAVGSEVKKGGVTDAEANGQDSGGKSKGKTKQKKPDIPGGATGGDDASSNLDNVGNDPNGNDLSGQSKTPGGDTTNDALIKNDPQFKNLSTEQFVVDSKTIKKPLDLIVAVDTSGSMGEEAVKVQQNIAVLTQFFSKEIGLDYHIWIMAGGLTIPGSDPQKVSFINQQVGSTNSLTLLTNLINGTIPTTVPLRVDTQKAFVIVTDDNASITAQAFINTIQADKRFMNKTSVNGLVWIDGVSKQSATCTVAAPGVIYSQLAQAKETLGAVYDLCADNWNPLFVDLAKRLVQQTVTLEYKLKQKADASAGFVVGVNGVKLDPSTYSYDAVLNAIVFAEGKAPPPGTNVVVAYKPT